MTKRKVFTFFWQTGKREVLPGRDAAEAMNNAGYSSGALRALDFYSAGDDTGFQWNAKARRWDRACHPIQAPATGEA